MVLFIGTWLIQGDDKEQQQDTLTGYYPKALKKLIGTEQRELGQDNGEH